MEEQVPVLGDLPVLPDEGKLSWVIRICSEKFPLTGGYSAHTEINLTSVFPYPLIMCTGTGKSIQ